MTDAIRWLTVDEAARYASCGKTTMYRAVRSGQLRAARPGNSRALRFLERWIDDWLMAGCVDPDEPSATERRTSPSAGMSTFQRVH